MKLTNVHYLYRIGRKAYRHEHKKVAGLIRLYMRIVCTCDIPFQADIDDSVHFNHNGFGIVINPSCKIGYSTDIQHNVTLGELRGGGRCTNHRQQCLYRSKSSNPWENNHW